MSTKDYKTHQKARFLSRCKHYSGQHDNDRCAKGVAYDSVRDTTKRPYRWPCTRPEEATTRCAEREPYTEADYEAHRAVVVASLERLATIRAAIIATGLPQGRIDCPCCDGRVGFSVASNGHVAAACSTKGCAKWVE